MRKILAFLPIVALWACAVMAQTPSATASLSWTAPTTNTNGSTITTALTYQVYQAAASGTTCPASTSSSYIAVGGVVSSSTALTLTLPSADYGTTQCFFVEAIEATVDSAPSNVASVAVPAAPSQPNAPTTVVVTVVVNP
jgi:hypothetical protein